MSAENTPSVANADASKSAEKAKTEKVKKAKKLDKKGNFPLRQRTGTAGFHLASDAVDLSLQSVSRWTKRE